jgi:hypothetical protein
VKSFAILCLLLIPALAMAQTEVSGNQSGIWTVMNSPYLVTGEITVPNGQSLSIEPGVEVNFQGHYKFIVNGYLEAAGSEAEMIHFTTDNPTIGWGGIRIDTSDFCSLSWCRIEYGKSSGEYPDMHGGGLALIGSDAQITNCVFADNDATGGNLGMGGAVYAISTGGYSEPVTRFIDCTFIGNHCYGEGGAIKFSGDTNSEVIGCEFFGNDCNYGGGAVALYGALGTKMINCTFADNYTMYSSGGAVSALGFSNFLTFVGCTISGNTAVTGDGGGVQLAYSDAYFVNTIIWDNPGMYSDDLFLDWGATADINYCNMAMPSGGTGSHNMNQNPDFVNAGGLDFHLNEDSPCIDEGTAYFEVGGEIVIDLDPEEYYGIAPDIGAFEYSPETGVSSGFSAASKLYPNYPNPFVQKTAISYQIAADSQVALKVFDVRGREVRTLLSGGRSAGRGVANWNGLDNTGRKMSPGVYFVRLQAGNEIQSMRVLLAR